MAEVVSVQPAVLARGIFDRLTQMARADEDAARAASPPHAQRRDRWIDGPVRRSRCAPTPARSTSAAPTSSPT